MIARIGALLAGAAILAGCTQTPSPAPRETRPLVPTRTATDTAAGPSTGSGTASGTATPGGDAADVLGGNAAVTFPAGAPGALGIVAMGILAPGTTSSLGVAVRNNTASAVQVTRVTGTGTAVDGRAAVGAADHTNPIRLEPGQVGLAVITWAAGGPQPQAGQTPRFEITTGAETRARSLQVGDVTVESVTVEGSATNTTGRPLRAPFPVDLFCFDEDNKWRYSTSTQAIGRGPLAADGTVTFAVSLIGGIDCPSYLVGVSSAP